MGLEDQIVQGITGLLYIGVLTGVGYIVKYVKAHFHSQTAVNIISGLGNIAEATVADFNQKVVTDAKAQGLFTPALAQSVKRDAIASVKAQGSNLIKLANGALGNVDVLIGALIERAVESNKPLVGISAVGALTPPASEATTSA